MALNALFTGSTGLQTFSSALDVVGNNLANLDTTGYKAQRAVFKDLVYQTLVPGSAPSGGLGGTNPTQSGFGVSIGSVDTLTEQGGITPTGRALDAAIQGDGFFVVKSPIETAYTRAGSFSVDAGGFLVDPNTGFRVQRTGTVGEGSATVPGFQVAGNNDIRVPFGAGSPGVPTSSVTIQGNLDANMATGDTFSTAIQAYDSQSKPEVLNLTFKKTGPNAFDVAANVNGVAATIATPGITFDTSGLLLTPASGTIDVSVAATASTAAQTITLNLGTVGQAVGITQFGGASTAAAVTQDGTGSGTLTAISFDSDGKVVGQFSNGRTVAIAQLALAGFNNEGGLLRTGSNYFIASAASGNALVGQAGTGGRGTIQGSALEGSNVDISAEFARLIIAQRGFQVNAQTITAANETLQELANIIR